MTTMLAVNEAELPRDACVDEGAGDADRLIARPSGRDGIPEAGWAGPVIGLGATAATLGWAWSWLWAHAA